MTRVVTRVAMVRQQNTVGFGVAVAAASHTTINLAYRRDTAGFAEDESFRGVNLADELNVGAHAFTYGAAFELTPLTTISEHGEDLNVTVDHDLRPSIAQETPYYAATGARATYSQRLVRNLDRQVTAGFDRIGYEARLDIEAGNQRDRVRTAGAGVGFRFGEGPRLGINLDYTARSSPVASREYSRGRMFATLTYGF